MHSYMAQLQCVSRVEALLLSHGFDKNRSSVPQEQGIHTMLNFPVTTVKKTFTARAVIGYTSVSLACSRKYQIP